MGSNSIVITTSMGIIIYRACVEIEKTHGRLSYDLLEQKLDEYLKICNKKSKEIDCDSIKTDVLDAQNFVKEVKENRDTIYDVKDYAIQSITPSTMKAMEESVERVLKK